MVFRARPEPAQTSFTACARTIHPHICACVSPGLSNGFLATYTQYICAIVPTGASLSVMFSNLEEPQTSPAPNCIGGHASRAPLHHEFALCSVGTPSPIDCRAACVTFVSCMFGGSTPRPRQVQAFSHQLPAQGLARPLPISLAAPSFAPVHTTCTSRAGFNEQTLNRNL